MRPGGRRRGILLLHPRQAAVAVAHSVLVIIYAMLRDRLYDLYVNVPMQKIVTDKLRPEGKNDPYGVEDFRETLEQLAGSWSHAVTFYPAPGAEPLQMTATSSAEMTMGGRYLVTEIDGDGSARRAETSSTEVNSNGASRSAGTGRNRSAVVRNHYLSACSPPLSREKGTPVTREGDPCPVGVISPYGHHRQGVDQRPAARRGD